MKGIRRGNCYTSSEAIYHLLGGRSRGWKSMVVRHEGDTHWFLQRTIFGLPEILDITAKQFKNEPPYHKARACGFLTRRPSKRANALMKAMLWQKI